MKEDLMPLSLESGTYVRDVLCFEVLHPPPPLHISQLCFKQSDII